MHRVARIVAVKHDLPTPKGAATRHLDETADVFPGDTFEQPPLHERILADAPPPREPNRVSHHPDESGSA
jgi:hypothetical protein